MRDYPAPPPGCDLAAPVQFRPVASTPFTRLGRVMTAAQSRLAVSVAFLGLAPGAHPVYLCGHE